MRSQTSKRATAPVAEPSLIDEERRPRFLCDLVFGDHIHALPSAVGQGSRLSVHGPVDEVLRREATVVVGRVGPDGVCSICACPVAPMQACAPPFADQKHDSEGQATPPGEGRGEGESSASLPRATGRRSRRQRAGALAGGRRRGRRLRPLQLARRLVLGFRCRRLARRGVGRLGRRCRGRRCFRCSRDRRRPPSAIRRRSPNSGRSVIPRSPTLVRDPLWRGTV